MASNRRLAKRYAKAFLHDDLDREAFEKMIAEIKSIVECIRSDDTVHEFFASPEYTRETKISVVRKMILKLGFNGYTLSLLEMLIRKNRIELLGNISDELQEISDRMHNRIRVTVTTAYEPSPDDLDEMSEKIGQFFGREVIVERRIDPSIIGGFMIEGEGKLIDMSVMGQIRRALSEI